MDIFKLLVTPNNGLDTTPTKKMINARINNVSV